MKNTKTILMFLFIMGLGILPFSQLAYAQEKNNFSFAVPSYEQNDINYAKLYGYLFSSGRIGASSTYIIVDELNPSKDTGQISAWFSLTPARKNMLDQNNHYIKLDNSIKYITWKVYGGSNYGNLILEEKTYVHNSLPVVQLKTPSTGSFKIIATLKRTGSDGTNSWDFEQETKPIYRTIKARSTPVCNVTYPSIMMKDQNNSSPNPTFDFDLGSNCANQALFSIINQKTGKPVYPYSLVELPITSQNITYKLNTALKAGNYKIFISVNSVNSKDYKPLNGSLEFIVRSNSLGSNENNGSNGYEINNYSNNGSEARISGNNNYGYTQNYYSNYNNNYKNNKMNNNNSYNIQKPSYNYYDSYNYGY